MQSNGFDRKMISGDLKKNIFSNPKGGPLCFQKRKSALVGFFLEKNPMTNKIEKFLYILEHLIPDGRDEIPTFALYHPLLPIAIKPYFRSNSKNFQGLKGCPSVTKTILELCPSNNDLIELKFLLTANHSFICHRHECLRFHTHCHFLK